MSEVKRFYPFAVAEGIIKWLPIDTDEAAEMEFVCLAKADYDAALTAQLAEAKERLAAYDKVAGAWQEGTDAIHKLVTEMLETRVGRDTLRELVMALPELGGLVEVVDRSHPRAIESTWQVWVGETLVATLNSLDTADALANLLRWRQAHE